MYGKTGQQSLGNTGTPGPVRIAWDGSLSAVDNRMQAAIDGRLFAAAMQTPTTTSTTLNTTFVGLGLCNPTGSGKILVVHEFSYGQTAAITAGALLALATTTDSGFATDIVPRCCRYGAGASIALVKKSVTIAAPVIERIIASLGQGANTVAMAGNPCRVDLQGGIVLPPGRSVVTDTTVAVGAVMQFGFIWEEIPLQ